MAERQKERAQIRTVLGGARYDLWRWSNGKWRRWTWLFFNRPNAAGDYAIQAGYRLDQTGVGDLS